MSNPFTILAANSSSFISNAIPFANSFDSMMMVAGRPVSVRALAGDGEDCLNCIKAIPKAIVNFFAHRYADFRMFIRAFVSMGGGTTNVDIDHRIQLISQLRDQILISGNNRRNLQAVHDRFTRLDATVQNLFFYVDPNYTRRFAYSQGRETPEIRYEIIRECDQAVSYQRTLRAVNTFYSIFTGNFFGPFGDTEDEIPMSRPGAPTSVGGGWTTQPGTTLGGVDLNIPGTVQYIQQDPPAQFRQRVFNPTATQAQNRLDQLTVHLTNQLPAAVRAKANQINALKVQFDNLANPPNIPGHFECSITREIMTVPVFDASHPAVQNALRAANAPGGTSIALNNRDLRHAIDFVSMEEHLIARNLAGDRRVCAVCRHPQERTRNIERQNLRIDTDLQDQILAFLTNAINGSTSTSAATTP